MIVPVVAIVGGSGSGKTRLIENLISELKSRGYRVAYVKHCYHGFELDRENTDSGRARDAGADFVVLTSPEETAGMEMRGNTLSELVQRLGGKADVVLAEGFRSEPVPKIEVFRSGLGGSPLCVSDPHLLAVVSDAPLKAQSPTFRPDDTKGVADFVENAITGGEKLAHEVNLQVDGSPVDLNDFVKSMISGTVMAMVSTLRGIEKPREIRLIIKKTGASD